jgi:comEA protein
MQIQKTLALIAMLSLASSVYAVASSKVETASDPKLAHVTLASVMMDDKSGKVVDVNQADTKTLEKVKGLGPKKAEAIVAYRNEHGKFQTMDDVAKVKGIGKKRLAKIRQRLTV